MVQDLDSACDQSLNVMTKIQWQNINNVGDQSAFVNQIITNFKQMIPVIRDNLATSRKYYTQFCHKFVNSFIPKYINTLYKLRPTSSSEGSQSNLSNIMGCEQLLLDTHSLKTVLLDLPSIGSQIQRKAPASYTKMVVKGMAKAEMIIKIVMQPIHPASLYIEQYLKLLPETNAIEFHKILDMKSIKRIEQQQLLDLYKKSAPQSSSSAEPEIPQSISSNSLISISDTFIDKGRIKKIENLIKNRLPN